MTEIEKVTGSTNSGARPSTARKRPSRAKAALPAGAKAPTDHASAKTEANPPKVQIIEWREDPETGEPFRYEINAEDFDDLDYVDALIEMETAASNGTRTTYAYVALKQLLGPERMDLWKARETITQGEKPKFSSAVQFFNSLMGQLKKGN